MFILGSLSSCLASAAAACACSVCTCASREAMVRSARMAWSFLFTLSMLLAWVLRDFAKPLLMKIPCAHVCDFGRFVAWENKRGQGGHARMGRGAPVGRPGTLRPALWGGSSRRTVAAASLPPLRGVLIGVRA